MADSVFDYITSTGTVVPDTSEIQEEIIQKFISLGVSEEVARNDSTLEGRLVEMLTLERKGIAINNAELANQTNPNLAYDGFFNALYALFGGQRTPQKRSSVDCSLTGVAGTVIPANSYVRNEETKTLWYTATQVTLDSNGEATVSVFSDEYGEIEAGAGDINQIVSAVTGWETITNPTVATLGREAQSLNAAKLDRTKLLYSNGRSTVGAVRSKVLNLEGVIAAVIRENRTNSSQTIDGVTIPAKSTWLCVDGGSINEIVEQYVINTWGTNFYGFSETVSDGTYIDPYSGQVYSETTIPVNVDRPTEVPIQIEVTASLTSSTDLVTQIKTAVVEWSNGNIEGYDGCKLGESISPFEISGALNDYFSAANVNVRSVRVSTVADDSLSYDPIDVSLWQKATVDEVNITVVSA